MLYHNNLILFFTLIIENLIFFVHCKLCRELQHRTPLGVVICRNSLHGRNDVLDFGLVLSRGLSWHKLSLDKICNLELNPLRQRGVQVGSF